MLFSFGLCLLPEKIAILLCPNQGLKPPQSTRLYAFASDNIGSHSHSDATHVQSVQYVLRKKFANDNCVNYEANSNST